jgi:hypothetical protein
MSAEMKTARILFLLVCAVSGLGAAEPTEIEIVADSADPAVYGAYPKNYQEIVTTWLATKLADAASAKIEWGSGPRPAELADKDGKRLYGYLVEFKVNSRNRFGAYTGMQKHGALIRDGNVIKGTGFGF